MLPYSDSRITKIVLGLFFLVIIGYAYYEARGLLYGPNISVSTVATTVSEPFIKVQGTAERIASLSMNGKAIAVTETGEFDEPYLLSKGYNRIILEATDKYGNEATRIIEIMYVPRHNTEKAPETMPESATTSEEVAS